MKDPPSDYRLLVPRDWFRVDLGQERRRRQLKTVVDKEAQSRRFPAEDGREIWVTLRNVAEAGLTRGALEFFLRTGKPGSALPASLLVSPASHRRAARRTRTASPRYWSSGRETTRRWTSSRSPPEPPSASTRTRTVAYHVHMPGGVVHLHLAFSLLVSGSRVPMGELCDAMAHPLRWV